MSGPPPNHAGTPAPPTPGTGTPTGMAVPPQQPPSSAPSNAAGQAQPPTMSQQNLNSIVLEYLNKKGYTRTEATLRKESANIDAEGRPIPDPEDNNGTKYTRAFDMTRRWIEDNIDIYKPELRKILWPLFVYSFLTLVITFYPDDSKNFFTTFKDLFGQEHESDLLKLQHIALPDHVDTNAVAQLYQKNKYRLRFTKTAFNTLIQFLESKESEGGKLIISIIQNRCDVRTVDRTADDRYSLKNMLEQAQGSTDMVIEDEGIPGHHAGSANTDRNAPVGVLPRLKLGALPMEQELMEDVQAELANEDGRHPPEPGQNSLIQEFEQHIKREESEDAPNRTDVPLPPSLARDVKMEVQKVKENRDRYRITSRTGGVGPAVSVVMYTFHNTYDGINCIEFSDDNLLIAAGMAESYIRVWTLDGKAIRSAMPSSPNDPPLSNSRRLIGHSGPVYGVSFSPSIASDPSDGPSTGPQYLLSCSADKSIRLWSLETWTCLVVYKGHDQPVWDVKWGPYGHYFLSGGLDKTARLWSTEHISALRLFAGHDMDVDTVTFHPNSAYVFTGSCDRTVRMWAITNGNAVRMFTGHTGNITALACSPNGKILASADDSGAILLWDLAPGRLLKKLRGHGKGGIWSLSWCVESTILVSGGADGTVRVWDVVGPGSETNPQGKIVGEGGAGVKIDGAASGTQATGPSGVSGTGKKKGKDVIVSPEQISAFPTKKSPVYKVRFTRQNLVVAGGAFLP
ncbi:MAG: Transcription initiation factor TFIID subunit 5 [Cirrosporium novae-zelandiae]|nr:MAG: Transcription initiation factor TFIID subunit 5 [Cirrosporium novae-zelandiae]